MWLLVVKLRHKDVGWNSGHLRKTHAAALAVGAFIRFTAFG